MSSTGAACVREVPTTTTRGGNEGTRQEVRPGKEGSSSSSSSSSPDVVLSVVPDSPLFLQKNGLSLRVLSFSNGLSRKSS